MMLQKHVTLTISHFAMTAEHPVNNSITAKHKHLKAIMLDENDIDLGKKNTTWARIIHTQNP